MMALAQVWRSVVNWCNNANVFLVKKKVKYILVGFGLKFNAKPSSISNY